MMFQFNKEYSWRLETFTKYLEMSSTFLIILILGISQKRIKFTLNQNCNV